MQAATDPDDLCDVVVRWVRAVFDLDNCAVLLFEPDWVEKIVHGRERDLRRALPRDGGAALLDLPEPMVATLLARSGWLPVEETEPVDGGAAR